MGVTYRRNKWRMGLAICGTSGGNDASAWEAVSRYKEKCSLWELEIENMNGVMSGIIEVKLPPIQTNGGFAMQKFFFTFGTSDKFPFRGGWVKVIAPNRAAAVKLYRSKYPDVNEGIINCSDIYTEEQFQKTEMVNENLGAACHDVLRFQEG